MGELLPRCSDPGFTPGEQHVAGLLAEWSAARSGVGDKALDQRVAKALGRGGAGVLAALLDGFAGRAEAERVVRLRAAGRIVGRDPQRASGLTEILKASLAGEPAVVREAARVIAKLPEALAGSFEAALVEVARRAALPERRAAVEALGRIGGSSTVEVLRGLGSETDEQDEDLRRRLGEAIALLERRAARASTGTIELDRTLPRSQTAVLRCRAGLAALVAEQLAARCDRLDVATAIDPTEVVLDFDGSLETLYRARSALDVALRFELPPGPTSEARVMAALGRPALVESLRAWTEGPVRFRLAWAGRGHRRAATWSVARALAEGDLPLVNDSRDALWTVEVDEARGHLDCRPALDPRFSYRCADVPAASHPTLAAALAWVAAPESGMTVWDPFCGSGQELIECARLADGLRLLGTDREPSALAAAADNVAAAQIDAADVTLVRGDAVTHVPSTPVDRIVSNPPMGRRVAGTEDLADLLRRFVEHAATCLAPGGTITWLSPRPKDTARIAAAAGLSVDDRGSVDLGGFAAGLQVLRA